jgi:hypothetical protein
MMNFGLNNWLCSERLYAATGLGMNPNPLAGFAQADCAGWQALNDLYVVWVP